MRVDIAKFVFDFTELNKIIDKENPSFLIMNQKTYNDFKNEETYFVSPKCYLSYRGIPVAVCNKISNGEVEVV